MFKTKIFIENFRSTFINLTVEFENITDIKYFEIHSSASIDVCPICNIINNYDLKYSNLFNNLKIMTSYSFFVYGFNIEKKMITKNSITQSTSNYSTPLQPRNFNCHLNKDKYNFILKCIWDYPVDNGGKTSYYIVLCNNAIESKFNGNILTFEKKILITGDYNISIYTENEIGKSDELYQLVNILIDDKIFETRLITIFFLVSLTFFLYIVCGFFIVVVIILCFLRVYLRIKKKQKTELDEIFLGEYDKENNKEKKIIFSEDFRIQFKDITFSHEIGTGATSIVKKKKLKNLKNNKLKKKRFILGYI
jgi:hypothetical protein